MKKGVWKKARVHDLRHMYLLGHESEQVTRNIYTHLISSAGSRGETP